MWKGLPVSDGYKIWYDYNKQFIDVFDEEGKKIVRILYYNPNIEIWNNFFNPIMMIFIINL